jgi:hypothetical protein
LQYAAAGVGSPSGAAIGPAGHSPEKRNKIRASEGNGNGRGDVTKAAGPDGKTGMVKLAAM